MTDILFTYSVAAHRNTYGDVYLRVGEKLCEMGFDIGFLDLSDIVADYVGSLESSAVTQRIAQYNPAFIISDEESMFLEMSRCLSPDLKGLCAQEREIVNLLMEEVDTCLFTHYWGRIQSNSSRSYSGSVEKKESFILRMREEDITVPTTILRSECESWDYTSLQARLGAEGFFVKEDGKHRSSGVHFIGSEEEFATIKNRGMLAQERIIDNGRFPCSLRVITFGESILGASLIYNTTDLRRSNVSGSIRGCPLTVPMHKEYESWLVELIGGNTNFLWNHGVRTNYSLRGDVAEIASYVGSMPSRSLLRGTDFCFDELGIPYLLETQTGPGNIRRGNFVKMRGGVPKDVAYNVQCVVDVLTCEFERLLKN